MNRQGIVRVARDIASEVKRRGMKDFLINLQRTKYLNCGTLVGTDKFGNKYFTGENRVAGRQRWVEYPQRGQRFNGSYVPPEWHSWMTYMTDVPLTEATNGPERPLFLMDHQPMDMSDCAHKANYLPPGHYFNRKKSHVQKDIYTKWTPGQQQS